MKPTKEILNWLLEEDNPDVRYLTLKNLLNKKSNDKELLVAKKAALTEGMVGTILEKQKKEGYWFKPGPGYSPKYQGTVWTLISLGQLGVIIDDDPRIKKACEYYLDHGYAEGGFFGYNGTPSGTIDCLQGNMCAALYDLGIEDERLDKAFEWMARSVTGEGVAPKGDKTTSQRYYAYKSGPLFSCGVNGDKSCAWGGVKVVLALSKLSKSKRTRLIDKAIREGAQFLLAHDIASADYPTRENTPPSRSWKKFGFPVFYVADILQNVEALVNLGHKDHPSVKKAIEFIMSKQNEDGSFNMEYPYRTWKSWGPKGKPNKWVTYRVYNTLKTV